MHTGSKGIGLLPVKQRFNTQGRKGRWECVVELVTENSAGGMDKVGRGQKCISRGDLLSMSTGAIRFVVGSTTDVLLSPVNRRRWTINHEGLCGFCKKPGSLLLCSLAVRLFSQLIHVRRWK